MYFKIIKQFGARGISIIELLISCVIVIIALVAFMYGIVICFKFAQISKESFFALQEASVRLEDIRGHNFSDIYNYYNSGAGHIFEVTGLPAGSSKGVVTIDNSNPVLLKAYISVCWRSADGRIVGEDANLDANLSPSEDTNPNNRIDSPVNISTFIARH